MPVEKDVTDIKTGETTRRTSLSEESRLKLQDLSKKALTLTLRYQRKYPEIIYGERRLGRIRLDKRDAFLGDFSKLIISDEKLRSIVVLERTKTEDPLIDMAEFEKKVDRVVAYCLSKNGSPDGALAQLGEAYEAVMLEDPSDDNLLSNAEILRLARLLRLTEDETGKFAHELHHMVNSARAILLQPIKGAMNQIARPG